MFIFTPTYEWHPQPFEGPVKVFASGGDLAALPAVMKNLRIELGGKLQQNVQTKHQGPSQCDDHILSFLDIFDFRY